MLERTKIAFEEAGCDHFDHAKLEKIARDFRFCFEAGETGLLTREKTNWELEKELDYQNFLLDWVQKGWLSRDELGGLREDHKVQQEKEQEKRDREIRIARFASARLRQASVLKSHSRLSQFNV